MLSTDEPDFLTLIGHFFKASNPSANPQDALRHANQSISLLEQFQDHLSQMQDTNNDHTSNLNATTPSTAPSNETHMVIQESASQSIASLKERMRTRTVAKPSPIPKEPPTSTIAVPTQKALENSTILETATEPTTPRFQYTRQMAEDMISKLSQTESMAEYIAQFQAVSSQLGWSEPPLLFYFKEGLSTEVKRILAQEWRSLTSLEVAQAKAREAYQRMHRLTPISNANNNNNSSINKSEGNNRTSSVVQNSPESKALLLPGSCVTRDLKQSLSPHNKLQPEERQRRMESGLCLYCGDEGHFALGCPRKAAMPSDGGVDDSVGLVVGLKKRHRVDFGDIGKPLAKSSRFV